jgi:hypothetical protein
MSCPVCQNATQSNKTYCSAVCARLFLSAVKEANESHPPQYTKPSFQKPSFQKPYVRSEPVGYTRNKNYEMNVEEKSTFTSSINRTPYQELLKQNQESVANESVSNKCKNERCPNQTVGNDLYCTSCDNSDDTKCKKCGVNDRNVPHPICTECHTAMKNKPKEKVDKTKKDKSKYNKKDKSKKV